VVDSATVDAVTLAGRLEAMVLDPVYSAEGLAGLMQLARAGSWRADQHVSSFTRRRTALFAYHRALAFSFG